MMSASLAAGHEVATADDYELHRMLLGLPEGPDELIPGQALPLESSMDLHGGGEISVSSVCVRRQHC